MALRFKQALVGALMATGLAAGPTHAALFVTPSANATDLANALLGGASGITINSATYTGGAAASGTFIGGAGIIGFESGIVLTSGDAAFVVGPNNTGSFSADNGAAGDAQLGALIGGATTFNASILDINFTPSGGKVTFNYVFGSEEYNEFVNTGFNDVFAFFVNGVNAALIPGTSTAVAINNVNCGFVTGLGAATAGAPGTNPENCGFYVNNVNPTLTGLLDTQLDGMTVVLSIVADVNAGVGNTLMIGIADTGDAAYDSAVFIQAGSFQVCGPGGPACPNEAPEPGVLALLSTGLLGLALFRRRRR
jgi:hypothetical protein